MNKAIFRYKGAPNALPRTSQEVSRYKMLVEADLVVSAFRVVHT